MTRKATNQQPETKEAPESVTDLEALEQRLAMLSSMADGLVTDMESLVEHGQKVTERMASYETEAKKQKKKRKAETEWLQDQLNAMNAAAEANARPSSVKEFFKRSYGSYRVVSKKDKDGNETFVAEFAVSKGKIAHTVVTASLVVAGGMFGYRQSKLNAQVRDQLGPVTLPYDDGDLDD